MINTIFGCTLKGYFKVRGSIWSFRWLRVMGCKAVYQLGRFSISSTFSCGRLSYWIRPSVCKLNHYVKINFLTSVAIFYVSPWGKKHSEPINTIEIYLNQFKLFVYVLYSSIRKYLKLKFYFGLVWGVMFVY